MKAIPLIENNGYEKSESEDATHVMLHLPCQEDTLVIPVILKGKREGTNCWSWNGDTEKPTLKPSVLVYGSNNSKSHSFINNGIVKYLKDSTHNLSGQEVELKEVKWS